MARVGLLNAYGSTVGDNLEHHLIASAIKAQGHQVKHLWNFNRQSPEIVRSCRGLVAGCGGILWNGSNLRNYFFINAIRLARSAVGCSIGYNQGEPLSQRWIDAVNHMEYLTARDTWTLKWIQENTKACARCYPSVAWIYKPHFWPYTRAYDLGLILNRRALEINLKEGNPWKLMPGIKGLKVLEIPFAQPTEQPFTPTINNNNKYASVASKCIRMCKVILAGRLHGFMLALVNGVPAIGVGSGFKVSSQASMCGYSLTPDFKELRDLNPQQWRDLIEMAGEVDPWPYVEKMRPLAAKHIEELNLWLRSL